VTYEILEHTAEVGIRARAATFAGVLSDLSAGLFSLITDPARVAPDETWHVTLRGSDRAELVVDWLNELLFLHDRDGLLAAEVDIANADATSIDAAVRGARFDPARHEQRLEVKAATYHQLEVAQDGAGWTARVYLDV
jgi:SHS2 domain-containing protein